MAKKFFIKTFGCIQNNADSEKISAYYRHLGYQPTTSYQKADLVIINSCIVREQAEDRVYGYVHYKLRPLLKENPKCQIVVTGCLAKAAKNNRYFANKVQKLIPEALITEIDIYYKDSSPQTHNSDRALVTISTGCNNHCSYCVVPLARGSEISRPFEKIMEEAKSYADSGSSKITLIGQNVNSYGADLVKNKRRYQLPDGQVVTPVIVRHLGKKRVGTLFPYLLEKIAKLPFNKIDFISANPWDFSDQLIETIAKHPNISREIHLPIQSGDERILKKMNRWYTGKDYAQLVSKIRNRIPEASISTDIIVGFPGETEQEFQNTVELCRQIKFTKAYIACYSPRAGTAAATMEDNVPHHEKDRRFRILDNLINHQK